MRRSFWRSHQRPLAKSIEDDHEDIDDEKKETTKEIITKNINDMEANLNVNDLTDQNGILDGRKDLDEFLKKDFGPIGRQDALANSDNSNAETAKKRLMSLLELEIDKALSWYEIKIMDCDNQIRKETKDGLDDVVADVQNQKDKLTAEKTKVEKIKADAATNVGIGLLPIQSYDRGFKSARAALAAAIIFGKKISNE